MIRLTEVERKGRTFTLHAEATENLTVLKAVQLGNDFEPVSISTFCSKAEFESKEASKATIDLLGREINAAMDRLIAREKK